MDRVFRLAHGWRVCTTEELSGTLISDCIRPAVHAVPRGMARQFGRCEVSLVEHLGSPSIASRWTLTDTGMEVSLAMTERDGHDIALELLVCLGQALWEKLSQSQRKAYWLVLDDEIRAGVPGEIDEEALKQKNLLLSSRSSATSRRRLERYGSASFAGTVAEYIHSLWHDVSVRTGPRFVPAERLRRRLELLAGWYPPGRTHPLFPPASRKRKS
jgi:hypothetical protein